MDMKFTNANWADPYTIAMEDHHHHHPHHHHHHHEDDHETPNFDQAIWPNYYNLPAIIAQNPPNSTPPPPTNTPPPVKADQLHNVDEREEQQNDDVEEGEEEEEEELGAMKEMMFKIAAMQPVDIDPATIRKPRRRNVRISDDPQSVAARHRRERISEKIRILQRLVPGGTKMDTASMLDEAIRYVKFLKRQIRNLQGNHHHPPPPPRVGVLAAADDWGMGSPASYLFGGTGNPDHHHHHHHPMC